MIWPCLGRPHRSREVIDTLVYSEDSFNHLNYFGRQDPGENLLGKGTFSDND